MKDLQRRITEMGYVFIKFTDTDGGTDLGVRVDPAASDLDPAASDLGGADFDRGAGRVHLEGTLTLNLVKVRCVTDIELPSLSGTGRLVALEEAAVV
ncbi:hypothetical protein [Streptomyces sp. NPDC007000]|uniref:hypothetical protein n=1 Tax=Streptomyces sp. NPDC007000 TaxID=3155357 RepID=UPI0033D79595